MERLSTYILMIAVLGATVFFALERLQPPAVLPATADPDLFSATRAMEHVRIIAAEPHPVSSAANRKVREYLVSELRSLDLEVSIQKTTSVLAYGNARAAEVQNIIAEKRGTGSSKAVMLVAHYDSETKAPGAGDDGYAIAAILETVRALKFSRPLKNDLVVLMTDAEEPGMFGARAFVDEYPLSEPIGVAMNFEGRGNAGPSMMFETTENNGWVVRRFSEAVRNKVAFSLMVDIYKLLPNNTDFTFLKDTIASGLNFAHIGGVEYYHSARDNPDRLDRRTLQHHGESMLAAVRYFGDADLNNTREPDVIYFPFLVPRFVLYPVAWNIPLVSVATLLFLVALVQAFRRRHVRATRLLIGFVLFVVRVLLAGAAVFVLWRSLGPLRPEFGLLYLQKVYHGGWFLAGFMGLAVFFGWSFHRLLAEKLGLFNLAFGALVLWLTACWGAALYLPDGSYLFVWPMITTVVALVVAIREANPFALSRTGCIVVALCAIPGLYLYAQLIDLLYQGMTLLVAGLIAILIVFLLGTMQHLMAVVSQRRWWMEPSLLLFVSAVCTVLGLLQNDPTTESPKPDSIVYASDMDHGRAQWITFEHTIDGWTRQFFSGDVDTGRVSRYFPSITARLLTGAAPEASLPGPSVTVEQDKRANTVRTLRLKIASEGEVIEMSIVADSDDVVYDARVNGKPFVNIERYIPQITRFVQRQSRPWALDYFGQVCELSLKIPSRHPFHLRVIQRFAGIPPEAMRGMSPRPEWTIPRPFYPTDMSIVAKTFSF